MSTAAGPASINDQHLDHAAFSAYWKLPSRLEQRASLSISWQLGIHCISVSTSLSCRHWSNASTSDHTL